MVEAPTETGVEGIGVSVQERLKHYYAGNGLFVSTRTERLQRLFDVSTYLLNCIGIRMNKIKTAIMPCWPCPTNGSISEAAYERRMKGFGTSYQEWMMRRVHCPEFGTEIATG